MVKSAKPTERSQSIPKPLEFRESFRRQRQEERFQKEQAIRLQEEAEVRARANAPVDERKQVLDYYVSIYGERQGERYKDLYFLEKELERLKTEGANFQKIFETQKAIAGKQQDISRTSRAGEKNIPRGPGIDTVITRVSGQKEILTSSPTGQKVSIIQAPSVTSREKIVSEVNQFLENPKEKNFEALKVQVQNLEKRGVLKPSEAANLLVVAKASIPKTAPPTVSITAPREKSFIEKLPPSEVQKLLNKKPQDDLISLGVKSVRRGIQTIEEKQRAFDEATARTADPFVKQARTVIEKSGGTALNTLKFLGLVATDPAGTGKQIQKGVSEFASNPVGESKKVAKTTLKEFEKDPLATFIGFASQAAIGKGVTKLVSPATRAARTSISKLQEKIDPRVYKDPLELVPGQQPTAPLTALKKLEGKDILAIHVSRRLPLGTVRQNVEKLITGRKQQVVLTAEAGKSGAGKFRSSVEQFSFYRSTPGKKGPRAYLQFAGVGARTSGKFDQVEFSLFKPRAKAFVEKVTVTPTKVSAKDTAVSLLAQQEKRPGKTFLAVENLIGASKEAQVTTPVKGAFKKTGRAESVGSVLQKERDLGFVFYREKVPVPKFVPKSVRKRLAKSDLFTETERIDVVQTKTLPAGPASRARGSLRGRPSVFDISSESRRTKIVSSEDFAKQLLYGQSVSRASRSRQKVEASLSAAPRQQSSARSLVSSLIGSSKKSSGKVSSAKSVPSISPSSSPKVPSRDRRFARPSDPLRVSSPASSPNASSGSASFRSSFGSFGSSAKQTRSSVAAFLRKETPAVARRRSEDFGQRRRDIVERAFGVFTRKGGKTVRVPGKFTQKDAFAVGTQVAEKTLRASFRVARVPGLARPRNIQAVDKEFDVGKNQFFVEPKERRLSTRRETKEIQFFRQGKRFSGRRQGVAML